MKINGETKIIGFLGSTYNKSKMYALYNAAFEALVLNYTYVPFVASDPKKAIDGMRALGIHALGVTIPFKISIIPFLDSLDANAKRIGAVNAVVNKNGKLIGANTDGIGGVKALSEKTSIAQKRILLLGAGGAARALAVAIAEQKGRITILNRKVHEAETIAHIVQGDFGGLDMIPKQIKHTDILINATSVGTMPYENVSLVPKELFHPLLTVMDVVSNPKETKLITDAKRAGCAVVFADRMLLWQAIEKFFIYTGIEPPISVMESAMKW